MSGAGQDKARSQIQKITICSINGIPYRCPSVEVALQEFHPLENPAIAALTASQAEGSQQIYRLGLCAVDAIHVIRCLAIGFNL